MSKLGEWLRQRRHPAEFRIDAPVSPVPVTVETVQRVEPAENVQPTERPADLPDDVVAAIATDVWRTRRKIGDGHDRDAPRTQRQAGRHLRAIWDRLAEAGVEIQEHEGAPFDVGMTLDVLAYQDDPDATKETVLETVRPSVYRAERCIQVGQVIVAVPEKGRPEKGQRDGSRDN